jgi:ribonuclease HI
MEIRAALEAIRSLAAPLRVVSDSSYVVNCFGDRWWVGWLKRGWVNSTGKPVANRDLWEPMIELIRDRESRGLPVEFVKVAGHSGHAMNDLVDEMARAAARALKDG